MGAPAARAAELSRHWARMGHETTVLTGFPNHPTGVVPEDWRPRLRQLRYTENIDGVRVERTWLWPLPNIKAHERIRNYASFCVSASITGTAVRTPDVVIATSPQLLCALAGWWIAFWKRAPFVFEVRDLWPESLAAVGAAREGSPLHRTLSAIARFLYRRADRIVVVSPAFNDHLIRHWNVPPNKIFIVENGVETDLFRPNPAADEVRRQLQLPGLQGEDRFLICYIGTMGNAHGLETLIAAAEQLQTALPSASFLLIGEGAEKEQLVNLASSRGVKNVQFLGQQPRERISLYISASDLCLVMLKKTELFKTVIPTKLLEYMACERAVIIAVDGLARQIVEGAGAGVFIEPENSQALVNAIVDLKSRADDRRQMGVNGRKCILNSYSRERSAERYIQLLEQLIAPHCDAPN